MFSYDHRWLLLLTGDFLGRHLEGGSQTPTQVTQPQTETQWEAGTPTEIISVLHTSFVIMPSYLSDTYFI